MIKAIHRIFWLFLPFLLLSCSQPAKVHHEQLLVFGTIVDIKLWGVDEEPGRRAVAQLAEDFDYMHRTWHAWHPGALGRINQLLPTGEWFSGAPSVLPLILRGKELSARSSGLFNPAIGKLIALWGFASDDPPKGPPPPSAEIQALVAQKPSMADIEVDGVRLRGHNPAVKLDFGAFAKGYAVDRSIERLQEMGFHNAIVNAGGDLRAIGRHGERPWRVGIRHPRQEGLIASVEVSGDESVFTSGDYERYFDWEGKRYDHIIDPRSGYPARGTTSVTVFTRQADLADAAATAITVAGPKDWLPIARAMGVSGVMVVAEDGTVMLTPGIRDRIHFEVDPPPPVVITEPLVVK